MATTIDNSPANINGGEEEKWPDSNSGLAVFRQIRKCLLEKFEKDSSLEVRESKNENLERHVRDWAFNEVLTIGSGLKDSEIEE